MSEEIEYYESLSGWRANCLNRSSSRLRVIGVCFSIVP